MLWSGVVFVWEKRMRAPKVRNALSNGGSSTAVTRRRAPLCTTQLKGLACLLRRGGKMLFCTLRWGIYPTIIFVLLKIR